MAYKWKPSKAAKRAFAEKMQDPVGTQTHTKKSNNMAQITKKMLQHQLEAFAKEFNEALTPNQAKEQGKESYISLDGNFTYGGYRLTRVKVESGAQYSCYDVHSMESRMNTSEMYLYLRALIAGKRGDNPNL